MADRKIELTGEMLDTLYAQVGGNLKKLVELVGPEAAASAFRRATMTEEERAFPLPNGADPQKWAEMVREGRALDAMEPGPEKGEKALEIAARELRRISPIAPEAIAAAKAEQGEREI